MRTKIAILSVVSATALLACRSDLAIGGSDDAGVDSGVTPPGDAAPSPATDGSVVLETLAALDGGPAPIGAPCLSEQETLANFGGFDHGEINVEGPKVLGGPVCVAFHFEGRVTCPYGQSASGQAPAGASPCLTPAGQPVVVAVPAQCTDRRASEVVTWSCRCANAEGRTDDGDPYCACPSSTACTPAVTQIGPSDHVSGSYCLSPASAYDPTKACALSCDPKTAPCP